MVAPHVGRTMRTIHTTGNMGKGFNAPTDGRIWVERRMRKMEQQEVKVCEECGGPIPPGKQRTARFCSEAHRKRAESRRQYAANPEAKRERVRQYQQSRRRPGA